VFAHLLRRATASSPRRASKISTSWVKSASDRVSRSTLLDDHDVDPVSPDIGKQALQRRPLDPSLADA